MNSFRDWTSSSLSISSIVLRYTSNMLLRAGRRKSCAVLLSRSLESATAALSLTGNSSQNRFLYTPSMACFSMGSFSNLNDPNSPYSQQARLLRNGSDEVNSGIICWMSIGSICATSSSWFVIYSCRCPIAHMRPSFILQSGLAP